MSSHHVVRDKQEPALIIANGEACNQSLLNDLLEWSPFVVVLDGAIHRVLDLKIKVDVLLGDFDRNEVSEETIRESQDAIEIVHTPDQNKTDLEKAIDFLIERGHRAVNVIWATGRRADHTIGNITSIVRFRNKITITILDDYSTIYLLPKSPEIFQKWYSKGTPISLIPLGDVTGLTTENLVYNLKNDSLSLGYKISSSNEVESDGIVKISYEAGDLLMMECLD
ncbi:MAG: thiamine diphosphokinase [Crocinitomicaceae bacterium]|nr:thiamine diphosphokinase [Crocinitomicaceae bacterium]